MSYSIVFRTVVVRAPDNRILLFQRLGCNNDNAGRTDDDYTGRIFANEAAYMAYAQKWMKDSRPMRENPDADFDLKIGGRYARYYDYGEHLIRMYKRAHTWDEFIHENYFLAEWCEKVELFRPGHKVISCEEFDRQNLYYTPGVEWRRICERTSDYAPVAARLEKEQPVCFTIAKRGTRIKRMR